jgi:signal transduction histidine kinase
MHMHAVAAILYQRGHWAESFARHLAGCDRTGGAALMPLQLWSACLAAARKLSLPASLALGAALLLGAGALDWVTGTEVASSIFYLLPITWVTWKAGRWPGLGAALLSGVAWLVLLLSQKTFAHPYIPLWNAFVRTASFCLISSLEAELLGRLRAERRVDQAHQHAEEQAGILQSILESMGDGVLVADSHGRLLHINPAARRTLRPPPQQGDVVRWFESLGNDAPDLRTGETSSDNPLLRALRGEAVDEAEMFLPQEEALGGSWLSVTGRPLRSAAGGIAGAVLVFSDITARKKLERRVAEVSESEQRRLGEDVHEGLCQFLVSTAFAARHLAARLDERSLPEGAEAAEIAELLDAAIAQARDVARGLCLVPLEAGGLAAALEEFAAQVRARHRIACQFVQSGPVPDLDEGAAASLLRIAQEAVNHAIEHREPRQITLALSAGPRQVQLEIQDDGTGFQQDLAPDCGMGLHMMSYRARMVGASFSMGQRPGGGTTVSCSVCRPRLAESTLQPQDAQG